MSLLCRSCRFHRYRSWRRRFEIPRLRIVEKINGTPEFDAVTGKNPFAKVKSLISDRTCRDERTSKTTEKKENLDSDSVKHSSTLETAVSRSTEADPESANEGHPDKICDQISDVVLDACLTCDTRCKVACETCVKDNMFMDEGEITVVGKILHETVMRCVAQKHRN